MPLESGSLPPTYRKYLATQRPIRCRLVRGVRVHHARWFDDNDLSCARRSHLATSSARRGSDHSFHGILPRCRLEKNRGAYATCWYGSRAGHRLPPARVAREHQRPAIWTQPWSETQSPTRSTGRGAQRTTARTRPATMTTARFGQPFRSFAFFSLGSHRRTNLLFGSLQLPPLWNWGFIWSGGGPFTLS